MAAAVALPSDRRSKLRNASMAREKIEVVANSDNPQKINDTPQVTDPAASAESETPEDMDVDKVAGEGAEEEDADEPGDEAAGDEKPEESGEEDGEEESRETESDADAKRVVAGDADTSEREYELVGAVKVSAGNAFASDGEAGETSSEEGSGGEDDIEVAPSEESSSVSAADEWEDASAGEAEADVAARNNCIFCKLGEDEDPSEEFEEYLACAVCGDNAHQQCAREEDSLDADENLKDWKCPNCIDQGVETEMLPVSNRRESAASQVPKELLPVAHDKPGAHSIFEPLIIEDTTGSGGRPLRKRKSSSTVPEGRSIASSKRPKRGSRSASEGNASTAPSTRPSSKHQARDQVPEAYHTDPHGATVQDNSARPRRQQKIDVGKARILIKERSRLLVAFKIDMSRIKKKPPKKYQPPAVLSPSQTRFPHISSMHYTTPYYSLHGQEADDTKKPYGGILTEVEADTSKTFPGLDDRTRFDDAKRRYEEEWAIKTAAQEAESELKGRVSTKVSGPPSKIKCINFGGYEIDTWYAAPYPEEYSRNRVLFICEFCLKYMPSDYVAWRHKLKCPTKHPPGDEIYRHKSISVFEVDGRKNPVYCQNLCLLAKLFLGSKTLYYDVEPFLFYIMTEYDEFGYHFVGYFSKEKRPSSMNNVSCILTLPIHQRKGYGNLLIDFSYLLTRVEQKSGSPEKPLSDMGLVSYRNYWRLVLARALLEQQETLSITKIADQTGMTPDDIIAALEALRALVRDPVTRSYALRIDRAFLKETIDKWEAKKYVALNPDALIWTPYIMGRNNLASYDRGAPISTVAPREDEEDDPATSTAVPEEGVQVQIVREARAAGENAATTIRPTSASDDPPGADGDIVMVDAGADATSASMPAGDGTATNLPPAAIDTVAVLEASVTATEAGATSIEGSVVPSSPKPNGISDEPSPPKFGYPIPPTRYEIYPPIPASNARRRPPPTRPSAAGTPIGSAALRGRPATSPTTIARRLANGLSSGGGGGSGGLSASAATFRVLGDNAAGMGSNSGTPRPRSANGLPLLLSAGPSTGATTPNGRRTRSSMLANHQSVEEAELARALDGTMDETDDNSVLVAAAAGRDARDATAGTGEMDGEGSATASSSIAAKHALNGVANGDDAELEMDEDLDDIDREEGDDEEDGGGEEETGEEEGEEDEGEEETDGAEADADGGDEGVGAGEVEEEDEEDDMEATVVLGKPAVSAA